MFEALGLVVHEGADGASQRDDGHGGGRFETRNQADEIANQNEKSQGHQEGSEALAVMSDNFLALTFDKTVSTFEDMLQGAGLVHREPRAHQEKQSHQKQKHQKLHGHGVGDGGLRVLGINMESLQQSRDRAGKEVVQDFGKPELFRHELRFWLLAPSFYSWLLALIAVRNHQLVRDSS